MLWQEDDAPLMAIPGAQMQSGRRAGRRCCGKKMTWDNIALPQGHLAGRPAPLTEWGCARHRGTTSHCPKVTSRAGQPRSPNGVARGTVGQHRICTNAAAAAASPRRQSRRPASRTDHPGHARTPRPRPPPHDGNPDDQPAAPIIPDMHERRGRRDDREPGAAGRSGSARIGPRDDREPGAAGRSGSARIGPRDDREPGAAGRSGSARIGPRDDGFKTQDVARRPRPHESREPKSARGRPHGFKTQDVARRPRPHESREPKSARGRPHGFKTQDV